MPATINSKQPISTGNTVASIEYLKNIIAITQDREALAIAHINLCVSYSAINKHRLAFFHISNALQQLNALTQSEYVRSSLSVAYYNAGAESEHLKDIQNAIKFYRQGINICSDFKNSSTLKAKLELSLKEASAKIERPHLMLKRYNMATRNKETKPINLAKSFYATSNPHIKYESVKTSRVPWYGKTINEKSALKPERILISEKLQKVFKCYLQQTKTLSKPAYNPLKTERANQILQSKQINADLHMSMPISPTDAQEPSTRKKHVIMRDESWYIRHAQKILYNANNNKP